LPIHIGRDRAPGVIGTPGSILGMIDDAQFEAQTFALAPGDVVVLYTDGATDVRPPHDLDPARFLALVDKAVHSTRTAEEVADRLHEALETVLPVNRRNDDIALLVLRVSKLT